jgi:signal transduction histidine kinase
MYGEILKQGWMSDEKRDEYYDYIYNEAERLSRLINNVLQISKVNRNQLDLELKSVMIGELVDLVKSKIDSQIKQSDFTLNIMIDSEMENELEAASLDVDKDAYVQIMINLVDNAIKYSANADIKQIDFKVSQNKGKKICFSIRDYGPGIAKNEMRKIFEPFYRSGDELTRECQGTGIGLALVSELAGAMNAKVEVVNHSQGVEFMVYFLRSK